MNIRFPWGQRSLLILAPILIAAVLSGDARLGWAQTEISAPKRLSTHLTGFGIPFRVDPNNNNFIEVHLYVSEDRGKNWRFHARQRTDQTEFPFQASGEGEYWFALRTLDQNRRLLPEGKIQPELIVTVDTRKPALDFRVQPDAAGRIACKWDIRDEDLDPNSLTIQYRNVLGPETAWTKVPFELPQSVMMGRFSDQVAWWPEQTSGTLLVKMSIADKAGNIASAERKLTLQPSAWRHRTESTAHRNTRPAPSAGSHSQPVDAVAAGKKVVCENGVCRLVDVTNQASDPLIGSPEEWVAPPVPDGFATSEVYGQLPRTEANGDTQRTRQSSFAGNGLAAGSLPSTTRQPPAANQPVAAPRSWSGQSSEQTGPQKQGTAPPVEKQAVPFQQQESIQWPGQVDDPIANQVAASGSTFRPEPQKFNPVRQPDQTTLDRQSLGEQKKHRLAGDMVIAESTARRQSDPYPRAGDSRAVNRPAEPTMLPRGPSAIGEHRSLREQYLAVHDRHENRRPENPVSEPPLLPPSITSAATQAVKSQRFHLNYGIDAIDDSGVDKVTLWVTRDAGQSWTSWGTDPDRQSPFQVEVEEQGVYGFRIVVQSRDGLAGRPPARGDDADMWILVDTEAPKVKITSVPYGKGQDTGRLIINWEAEDPQLGSRPITISYATTPSGPWTTIEHGLRNEGRFAWKVSAEVPERVYLRIEARDRAGNVGVFQLRNLIDISGLVPRGRINGVQPIQ